MIFFYLFIFLSFAGRIQIVTFERNVFLFAICFFFYYYYFHPGAKTLAADALTRSAFLLHLHTFSPIHTLLQGRLVCVCARVCGDSETVSYAYVCVSIVL